ncbi:MAG: AAA family ATPase [Hyphomicrobiaceae bacterium]
MSFLSDPTLSVKRNTVVALATGHRVPPESQRSDAVESICSNHRVSRGELLRGERSLDRLLDDPPDNIPATEALLGSLLVQRTPELQAGLFARISLVLSSEHIQNSLLRRIFECVGIFVADKRHATPLTLASQFRLDEMARPGMTVRQYLVHLGAHQSVTEADAIEFSRDVRDCADRRQIIYIAETVRDAAYDNSFPLDEQLSELAFRAKSLGDARNFEGVDAISASAFAGKEAPPRAWHAWCVPVDNVTALMGDGGTGKSTLALQLAACTALGLPWLGHPVVRGSALYIGAEDDLDEMHRRVTAIARDLGVGVEQLSNLHLVSLAGEDAVLATADESNIVHPTALWRRVCRTVAARRPNLVIYDTLADLFAGNENSRPQARQFIGMIRGLALKTRSTAVLLAHPSQAGMTSGAGTSGSTAWSNSVRSRLYLDRVREDGVEPDPDARVLRTKKANYGPQGLELRVRWCDGVFIADTVSTNGSLALCAKQLQAEDVFIELLLSYNAAGRPVGASFGANYAPTVFARDERGRGIGKKLLEAAMNRLFECKRLCVLEYGPPTRRRKRLEVA